MPNDCITYQNSGYFSKLITDYLDNKTELDPFYNRSPTLENFKAQIAEKKQNYPFENRQVLFSELEKQYTGFEVSDETKVNIESLKNANSFTITTGHQLNLFTGPLYFLYKIVSVINMCKTLKAKYPEQHFVPVYWMATEDHDFEEINYFNFQDSKIKWNRESSGPVGRLSTAGLESVLKTFENELGNNENASYLKELFHKTYLDNPNLTNATRYLANELFKKEGLIILDGDSPELKKLFVPYTKEELLHQTSFEKVSQTNALLDDYKIQVNPREINLFYIEDTLRERIVLENGNYSVNTTSIVFTEAEILTELQKNPEKFSPNVIMRPLYQEVILPNLAYVGGGGEIAYWLQLKTNFEANGVTFPILMLRNSVLLATQKQAEKADRLELTWADLFSEQKELINRSTNRYSEFTIDFSEQKEHLRKQFDALTKIAEKTHKSFSGALKAQEAKQIKGLENLEKRLLKAEKRIHADELERIIRLQNELFPNQSLQERTINFSEFYEAYGTDFIKKLLEELHPLKQEFNVVIL